MIRAFKAPPTQTYYIKLRGSDVEEVISDVSEVVIIRSAMNNEVESYEFTHPRGVTTIREYLIESVLIQGGGQQ